VSVVDTGIATDIVTIKADTYTSAGVNYSDLKIVLVFNVGTDEGGNSNTLISASGLPDGVTGLDKSSLTTWYQNTIPDVMNVLDSKLSDLGLDWESDEADVLEVQVIQDAVEAYFISISLNTQTTLSVGFDIKDTWITTETKTDTNNNVVGIVVRSRSESIGTETEREEFFDSQAQLDAGTPTQWVERSNSFKDNVDGSFSMIQEVTSSEGEDMTRTETYNEDGTTTVIIKGTVLFEGMLVQNAEIYFRDSE